MDTVTLTARPRPEHGKRAAARLRKQDLVPAVIYGHKEAVEAVALPRHDLESALRHHARIMDLQTGGKTETAVIQEVQYDHLGVEVLHVDFKRVSKDERIVVSVAVELKGAAPGLSSGVMEQPLHDLEVECLAVAIPESIKVNVSNLQVGQAVHVKELTAPEGVTILTDPEAIVVQIKAHAVEPEPTAAPAAVAPGAAEPEIVGRRVKEEEGEE